MKHTSNNEVTRPAFDINNFCKYIVSNDGFINPDIFCAAYVGKKAKNGKDVFYIMAVAEGYAMVRRPRCMPFTVTTKKLKSYILCGGKLT